MQNWRLLKVVFLTVLVLLASCKGDDITVNTENNRLYEIATPTVNYTYSVADGLVDLNEPRLSIGENGLIYFTASRDASTVWEDLAYIGNVNKSWPYVMSEIVVGSSDISIEEKVKLNSKPDVRYDNGVFKSGNLLLTVEVPLGVTGTIKLTVPDSNPLITTTITLNGFNPIESRTILLDDRTIVFGQEPNSSYVTLKTEAQLTFPGAVLGAMKIDFQLTDIKTKMLRGYFGQYQSLLIDHTNSIDKMEESKGFDKIELGEITYVLETNNHIGVPFEIEATNIRFNRIVDDIIEVSEILLIDGVSKIKLNVNAANEGPPLQPTHNSYIVRPDNSNITDVGNPFPQKIIVNLDVNSNPLGDTGTQNFIGDIDSLYATLTMKAPLYLKATNYSRKDTIKVDFRKLLEQDRENTDIIETIAIHLDFYNKLPFEVQANLSIADTFKVKIEDILFNYNPILAVGKLNAEGKVAEAKHTNLVIEFEKSQIKKYFDENAMFLILETKASSANGENEYVKIFDDSNLMVSVSIEASGKAPDNK